MGFSFASLDVIGSEQETKSKDSVFYDLSEKQTFKRPSRSELSVSYSLSAFLLPGGASEVQTGEN